MADQDPPVIDTAKIIEEVVGKVSETIPDTLKDTITEQVKTSVTEATSDISTKLKDEVVGNITAALTGKRDDPNTAPWVREHRNPLNYEEVAEWGKLQAEKAFDAKLAEKEAKERADKEAADKSKLEGTKQLQQQWDTQIAELTTKEFIPAPAEEIQAKLSKNEKLSDEDLKDPGIEARRELFKLGSEHQETNLELVYYKYYLPEQNKKQPGMDAPVIGKTKSQSGGQGELSYEELHSGTMFDIAKKAVQ